jgi:photosystem II stability/assembly factor-like uncharacterized protein
MRDEELRRRIGQVAEYGEHAVSPPDPALLYRRARRRVARLTGLSVLLAGALLAGGLAVRTSLAGGDLSPAVTGPPGPATTVVPPTTAGPPGTTSPPTTRPAVAPARFPAAPPMVGDAEGTVLAAQLVTPDSGWALTTGGLAWTGDGARSWRTITPAKVPAGRVRGAFFLDSSTGWMVASARERETGSRVQLAVYRTGDAGSSWGWSSLGQLDLGGDDAGGGYEGGFGLLAQPSFVDRRHGWISVLTVSKSYKSHRFLFRTSDGGRTWTRLPQPPAAPELVFSSRTSGWTVVPGSGAASPGGGRGPGLYRTDDAGRGWSRVELGPPAPLRGTEAHLREPPTFRSPLDGYLPVEFVGEEGGRPRILAAGFFVTGDGGKTWTPRYVPLAEADEEWGLLPQAVGDRTTLLALVGHESRKVLTSRNGGRTWSTAASGLEGRYPAVRGLAFAGPRTGWAVTGRGTSLENGCQPPTARCDDAGVLLRTTTGGTGWSEITPGR